MVRNKLCALMIVLLVSALVGLGQDGGPPEETIDLSTDRELGVGIQVDFPFGGLLSCRYWIGPRFGGEMILFFWGTAGGTEGTMTVRVLSRIADRPIVDFYGALGASFPISPYGWDPAIFSAVGGIEFGFRLAPALAWDIEFGLAYATDGEIGMVFGVGVHFYF